MKQMQDFRGEKTTRQTAESLYIYKILAEIQASNSCSHVHDILKKSELQSYKDLLLRASFCRPILGLRKDSSLHISLSHGEA